MARYVLIVALCFVLSFAKAQDNSDNRRCQTVMTNTAILPDRAFDPATLRVNSPKDSLFQIEILAVGGFIIKSELDDKVEICYRLLPDQLTRPFKRINLTLYDSSAAFRPEKEELPLLGRRDQLFSMGELNHAGQISRGITVGNTQNLFVNSSLNLSLDGKISDDLSIRASITDQFIPYQPEGNTQQLQDFDNVFVELYNDKFSVIGGDVIYQNGETHFLKYYKNVQGGAVRVNHKTGFTGLGMSAAKGQFASVAIPVNEGMQGPYKIPSPTPNQFVIILANSERVYLDGKRLSRGFDQDYVIDYNQGEVTFTSNIVITKYSRIRIDYEYSSRYYSRSIMHVNHTQQVGRLNIQAAYYRESDNRLNPLLYALSEEDKRLLESAGNNTDSAVVLSATLVPFADDKILYALVDTLAENGQVYKIFNFHSAPADSLYSVTFTNVGAGRGSYEIKEYLAQGRIYQWVGKGQGSFEPYRQLVAPTRKEMVDLKLSINTGNYSRVYVESAFSNQDLNLFSALDNEQNQGYALRFGHAIDSKPLTFLKDYRLNFYSDVEYLNAEFKAIDRFRRVEFDRDWGIYSTDTVATSDFVMRSALTIEADQENKFNYAVNLRHKMDHLTGIQHQGELNKSLGKLQINLNGFLMNSDLNYGMANWRKFGSEIYLRGKIEPGYRYELQQNTVMAASDSILASANYFSTHEFYLRNGAESKTRFELAYNIREDRLPVAGEMRQADYSNNVRLRVNRNFNNGHQLGVVFNYRLFSSYNGQEDVMESISGRLDWSGDIIPGVFRQEVNYSVANVRVPRREYVFVEVATGEGTHTWRDDNLDGIKDLDEFYEAIHFDERNFVKMYVNTTDFHDAYENSLNYRANLRLPTAWRSKGGILGLLAKISNTTSWTSNYRTTEESVQARLIPFLADLNEDQVLSLREAIRSTFFINKANPKFGMSLGYAKFRKKHLYTNGFEGRSDEEYNATFRWNIKRKYNIKFSTLNARRVNRSDYLLGRNYDINEYRLGPSFSWQPKPTVRLTGTYNVGLKQSSNSTEAATQTNLNEVIAELKIGKASSYSFNANFKYSNLLYDGDEFTPVGYEMLQGLRPGDNITWQIGWQQKLFAGLQLNLFYEGRRPDSSQVIHSGRASVSALF